MDNNWCIDPAIYNVIGQTELNVEIDQFVTKTMGIVMGDQKQQLQNQQKQQQLQNQLKQPLKNHQTQLLFAKMWNAKETTNFILKVLANNVFVNATMVLQVKFAVWQPFGQSSFVITDDDWLREAIL